MSQTIEIHEFSTGIEIIGTPGNWVAGGFTGNYINSTLESVPISVQNAIASQYFAVAESTSSDKPAVIGREINGADGDWSVVAVVTKGTDNMGRPASLYRYFLCQGSGKIHYILQWMNQEKKRILVFDPFDEQTVGHPHRYKITSSNSINVREGLESLLDGSPTVIVPSQEPCAPIILNEMANRLGHPVSWAYHVKGVVNPTFFQIIQPVDSQSEQIIRLAIARTPKRPQLQGEEQPITTAIKGLTNREKFKPEHIQTIEKALANPQIKTEAWKDLFERRGAKDAINDKIYTPPTVRLLTLQAMVLPETLPAFLSWILRKNKQEYNIYSAFQQQMLQYLHRHKIDLLLDKLIEGVILIIPHLVEQPELLESTVWLLGESQGIWGYLYRSKIMPEIDRDFQSIAKGYRTKQNSVELEVLNHSAWKKILNDIQPYWQPNANKYCQEDYQPIADFFYKLQKVNKSYQQLQLHALFLYISQGKIPKELFLNLKQNRKSSDGIYVYVYDVPLEREFPWDERLYLGTKSNVQKLYFGILNIIKTLWRLKVTFPFPLLVVFILISFLPGIYYRNLYLAIKQETSIDQEPSPGISDAVYNTGFDKFEITKQVIKEEIYQPLFEEFNNASNNHQELRREIIKAISKTLAPENKFILNYSVIENENLDLENNPEEKEWVTKWIESIRFYQQKKKQENSAINVVGYLLPNGLTNEPLRNDIKNNIDPKFTAKVPDDPSSEAFARFESTRKVIKDEIYQPLFEEFNNRTNNPDDLRIGIITAIRETIDPPAKESNLQFGDVIENENLDLENNPEEKEWVTKWIESIRFYQQKKKQENSAINVVGYLVSGDQTNKSLKNDIRKNIAPKFKTTTTDHSDQPPVP